MNKQGKDKIDWCDYSWNPVTGCYNNCSYCYAKKIAERFRNRTTYFNQVVLNKPVRRFQSEASEGKEILPFPYGFTPTFHRYRLDEPQAVKKPSKIFVCSMADLFGDWVPDEWIEQVFDACRKAPQHTYLFLTKNPERYADLIMDKKLYPYKNFGLGSTVVNNQTPFFAPKLNFNTFISFEPILERQSISGRIDGYLDTNWLIFGAMTKNGRNVKEYEPKWDWIKDLVVEARKHGIPIFMKQSMKGIVPEGQFTQEYPKEMR